MLQIIFGVLCKLPKAVCCWFVDVIHYYRDKWYLNFEKWGLHLFVGKFGAGKTSTMVYYAYQLAKKYKCLNIVTNIRLRHFPKWTRIYPLNTPQDILNAPVNTLVLIDEIGTIFNSRDFSSGKDSIPKFLFQHLCQCRKRHMMIYGTTQRWNFLDKQLRDITDTVFCTRSFFSHPFSRLCLVFRYDAVQYDASYSNPLLPCPLLSGNVYVQTDNVRKLYSTDEVITNMLNKKPDEFLSDREVLESRGDIVPVFNDVERKSARRYSRRGIYR